MFLADRLKMVQRQPEAPPLTPGDYIWYKYDPDTGYENSVINTRLLVDTGEVVIEDAGNYPGKMYGSNHVALNEGGNSGQYVDLTIPYETGIDEFYNGIMSQNTGIVMVFDKQIEEILAEDFREFILSKELFGQAR